MPKKISISKIKDALIKKLGGYTEHDMFEERMITFHEPKIVTQFQLAQVFGSVKSYVFRFEGMSEEEKEKIIKDELFHQIANQIRPFIEYQVGVPEPPTYEVVTARARLRVMQPEEGDVVQHMHYPL